MKISIISSLTKTLDLFVVFLGVKNPSCSGCYYFIILPTLTKIWIMRMFHNEQLKI